MAGQRVFPTLLPVDDVVRLQGAIPRAAPLAPVAIAHEAGYAQVLIQPGRILVLDTSQIRVVQARDVYLHILDHDVADGQRQPLDDADDLFYVGFDRRW